jgi:uncharacterized protein (DUF736 family)
MSNEYPNTGALWNTKEKKHEKAPDMWGKIEFERDYLQQMLDESNGLVTVKIDAWNRESSTGNAYLSIKVNTWKPEAKKAERMPFDD